MTNITWVLQEIAEEAETWIAENVEPSASSLRELDQMEGLSDEQRLSYCEWLQEHVWLAAPHGDGVADRNMLVVLAVEVNQLLDLAGDIRSGDKSGASAWREWESHLVHGVLGLPVQRSWWQRLERRLGLIFKRRDGRFELV